MGGARKRFETLQEKNLEHPEEVVASKPQKKQIMANKELMESVKKKTIYPGEDTWKSNLILMTVGYTRCCK